MKKINLTLKGWADSRDNNTVKFLLQLAMKNCGLDNDYSFEIKDWGKTGYVYDPWTFRVIAKRVPCCGYMESGRIKTESVDEIRFEFTSKQFTEVEVYEACVDCLKKKNYESHRCEIERLGLDY